MKNRETTHSNERQDNKYKFIPPSKLMNAKIHAMSNKENYIYSLAEIQDEKKETGVIEAKTTVAIEKNKENKGFIGKRAFEIVCSLSNQKLTTSNSRNAILKQKNPPVENYRKDSVEIERSVDEHLDEVRIKEQFLKDEILVLLQDNKRLKEENECVVEENKLLNEKLGRLTCLIVLKNKQISSLHGKARELEAQVQQKNQENKVIQRQSIQINELTIQTQINQNKLNSYLPNTLPIPQRYPLDSRDTARGELKFNSFNSSRSHIESLLYEEDIPKTRVFLHMKENIDEEDGELFDEVENEENLGIENMIGEERIEFTTPCFGTATPQQSLLKINKSEKSNSDDLFLSEAEQDQQNMSLSRISESVEEDNETERSQNRPEDVRDCCNQTKSQSTHQQLLDEIDQYLSKRTKFLSK